ncbi:MAG: transposase, partial [Bacilli bacterium]|nr:transposase [Bacilli bacterium]
MKIITQEYLTDKRLEDSVQNFSSKFNISILLKSCNACKIRGFSVAMLFQYLLKLAFSNRSMYMNFITGKHEAAFSKDAVYRLLNNASINWLKFTASLAARISNKEIVPLTEDGRRNVLIIDDSLFERPRSKNVELLARVFDHTTHCYKRGFRLLTLGWSDGNSFLPVASRLMSSEKDSNVYQPSKEKYDRRTLAYKRREQARSKSNLVMLELLSEAKKAAIQAKHLLFDTWFCSPSSLLAVKNIGYDVVAMAKKSSKIHYTFEGTKQSVKDIYKSCKKRRGRSKYLLSVEIEVEKDNQTISARLVFVRNRNNSKDWLVLISTDTSLTEDEIIQLYGKRWNIEVFFKICKSYLKLGKEFRSLSYDAMTAHVAVVFTRYMMLSVEHRQMNDPRSLGELFFLLCDELSDLSSERALFLIINAVLKTVKEKLFLTAQQLDEFIAAFIEMLPNYIK